MRLADATRDGHEAFHEDGKQTAKLGLDDYDAIRDRVQMDADRRVRDLQPHLSPPSSIIDIGAGYGTFVEAVEPLVDSAVGAELNHEKRRFADEKKDLPVVKSVEAALSEYGAEAFDLVTMFHVLEHLPEPVEQLKQITRLLAPNGVLIIEVPNHDDWMLSISAAYRQFYYQEAHAYYFDRETATDVLNRARLRCSVRGVQRYTLRNALTWIVRGRPELNNPSQNPNTWRRPINNLYSEALSRMFVSDTLWIEAER